MIVNATALAEVFRGLKMTFDEAVQGTEAEEIELLMATVPSTTATERYPVATLLGDLEEVLDEVTLTNIGTFIQSVPNVTYARAVQVRRDDIADDNIGVYKPAVQQLGRRAALYPLRLAAEALISGFTDTWTPDGQVVFSNTHTWPGSAITWDNLNNVALSAANFDTAYAALEARQDPMGVPMGLTPDTLICGPSNRSAAEAIVEAQFDSSGASNTRYRKARMVVLPRITGSHWFLADTDTVKPMVLQDREAAEFTAKEDPSDDDVFYRERFAYKGRRRCAVAILAPWLIQASNGG